MITYCSIKNFLKKIDRGWIFSKIEGWIFSKGGWIFSKRGVDIFLLHIHKNIQTGSLGFALTGKQPNSPQTV